MKRFIGLLTLIGFIVVSNIQLIHAAEMKNMQIHENHIMQNNDESIFCDTGNKKDTECAKEVFPDKLVQKQEKIELNSNFLSSYFLIFQSKTPLINKEFEIKINSPPNIIFQRSDYHNLNGIIKNLN